VRAVDIRKIKDDIQKLKDEREVNDTEKKEMVDETTKT
jgi:hypothetical protein